VRLTLRITVHLIVAFALASFASGCRTPRLQIETPGDASGYRTWDFVQPVRDVIHAPLPVGIDLDPVVAKQVEIGLSDRGFRRTTNDPDLLVYFKLVVREQLVEQNVTGAIQHLPSLSHSPSYDVQVTRTELIRYEIAELLVLMLDPREHHLVWRGRLNERYRDEFAPHLGEAVSQLLAQLPPPRPSTNGRTVIVKAAMPQDARTTSAPKPTIDALTEPGEGPQPMCTGFDGFRDASTGVKN
jgi:hypothetical protein